jgi:hypothetical protein
LDVSANTALSELICLENSLSNLDVSTNTSLKYLNCALCGLTNLDISNNTALEHLECYLNQITVLNLTANKSLKFLICDNNQLTSLDLTANQELNILSCEGNLLTSIDVSDNSTLTALGCSHNHLMSLDVSGKVALTFFDCSYNQIANLDISSNTALTDFRCNDNQLTSLNTKNGHPTPFWVFRTNNNPNLNCIQVDDIAYSTSNWYYEIDPWTSFSETCTVGTDNFSAPEINIFPNPGNGIFTISGLKLGILSVDIFNLLGDKVYSNIKRANQINYNIDIAGSPKGVYLVKIYNDKDVYTQKIVIE